MADRLDTIATELNLTFGQVCTELARRGVNFQVMRWRTEPVIKIQVLWKGDFDAKKAILDDIYISYSTGHDTGGYFILIHARID